MSGVGVTDRTALAQRAAAVLDANWTGRSTVPSRRLYPHQWSWDSAFAAIGWAHLRPERAATELGTLFAAQWPDGRVPHIVFDASVPESAYFPGPAFWRTGRASSGIVQPPVHALAVRRWCEVADPTPAPSALRALYPALCAQQRYFGAARDVRGRGLVAVVHPWESGRDNSVDWDGPLAAVPPPAVPEPFRRRDLASVPAAERPRDADYARYVALAAGYRDASYRDDDAASRPFLVECPLVNALRIASDEALAHLATMLDLDPEPHRQDAARRTDALVGELVDADGRLRPLDVHTGRHVPGGPSVAALVPLVVAGLPRDVADTAVRLARSVFGLGKRDALVLPSQAPGSDGFDRRRYWRGPIWLNTNWLVWRGLVQHGYLDDADRLAEASLGLVERSGFSEYFDPVDGTGRGADAFTWTAALALDLLAGVPR